MSVVPSNINLLSTEDKLQAIQNVKAETEALRQRIVYTKNQIMDATCKFSIELKEKYQHTNNI